MQFVRGRTRLGAVLTSSCFILGEIVEAACPIVPLICELVPDQCWWAVTTPQKQLTGVRIRTKPQIAIPNGRRRPLASDAAARGD